MRDDLIATNIILKSGYSAEWWATLHWIDGRFCETGTVQGEISTIYGEQTISGAVDAVLEVAETFNLKLRGNFHLFYLGDGENVEHPPPDGWREMLIDEAERRGWKTYKRQED